MRKLKILLFILFLGVFITPKLFCEIIEIQKLEEALTYIDSSTLVVLDIDDTLMVPAQMLGGDCWFRQEMKRLQKSGDSFEKALARTLPNYMKLQHVLEVNPVEPVTAAVVQKFQQRAQNVIGLTTRSTELAYRTFEQLKGLGIDLAKASIKDSTIGLSTHFAYSYIEGVLFTQVKHKGQMLKELCQALDYHPQKIIFINDKLKYVAQLEETFPEMGITYLGLRYAACDADIQNYDSKVTQLQLECFQNMLSDEQALTLLDHLEKEVDND